MTGRHAVPIEQIATLLFATTLVTIFSYLLAFYAFSSAGNGGRYWGFDGRIEAQAAAELRYTSGDRRFLAYEFSGPIAGRQRGFDGVYRCDFHDHAPRAHLRLNEIDGRHGADSVSKAASFAREYNDALRALLAAERRYWCEPWTPPQLVAITPEPGHGD